MTGILDKLIFCKKKLFYLDELKFCKNILFRRTKILQKDFLINFYSLYLENLLKNMLYFYFKKKLWLIYV